MLDAAIHTGTKDMNRRRPLHILQIIPEMSLSLGGPLISAINLGSGLKKIGHRVSYLTINENLDRQTMARFGLKSDAITQLKDNRNSFIVNKTDRELILTTVQNADVIHIHGVWETLIYECLLACYALGIPAVMSPCGMLDRWSLEQKELKKKIYLALRGNTILSVPTLIHATSRIERLEIEHLGISTKKIVEIPLATTPLPDDGQNPISTRLQKPAVSGPYRILFLGRLLPTKGVELLIQAFTMFASRVTDDVQLIITGPGTPKYRSHLVELTRKLGIAKQTQINAAVSGFEVFTTLQNADLFVLPSQHENFGLSIIESLAAGTPVVISDKTGVSDLVSNSMVGGVSNLDIASVSSKMEQWYRKKRDEPALKTRCMEFVKSKFCPEIQSETWSGTYQSLVPK